PVDLAVGQDGAPNARSVEARARRVVALVAEEPREDLDLRGASARVEVGVVDAERLGHLPVASLLGRGLVERRDAVGPGLDELARADAEAALVRVGDRLDRDVALADHPALARDPQIHLLPRNERPDAALGLDPPADLDVVLAADVE